MTRYERYAAFGLLAWLFVALSGATELAASYLVMAGLVHVPLAMHLLRPARDSGRLWSLLDRSWPPSAVALALSAVLETGAAAGALAFVWFGFTLVLATYGVARFLHRGGRGIAELVTDAGLVMLPVGGAWTVAWRLDLEVLGFSDIWVLLTAVHFHFAAFLLPVIIGGFLRWHAARGKLAKRHTVVVGSVLLAVPLTAIGIATNQTVEFFSAVLLSLGVTVFALDLLRDTRLALPGASAISAMVLAAGYATATTFGLGWLGLEEMVVFHGSANAIGFTLLALYVLVRIDPRPAPEPDVPFSALRGDFRVGTDYFERIGATTTGDASGLVDRLDELNGSFFDSAAVDSRIARFYEQTADYDLDVEARWKWWFAWAGRVWHVVATRIEQTVFPVGDASRDRRVLSEIVPLTVDADGRPNPRAWIRTFADSGRAMYAAAYSTHRHGGVAYMNIAFPMWRSNMASVLVPENIGDSGLRLDTTSSASRTHAGIWQVTDHGSFRLPLREHIDVWAADDTQRPADLDPRGAPIVARHVLTAFGVHYLTLDYRIR